MLLGDHREWAPGEAPSANRPRNTNGITYLGSYALTNRTFGVRLAPGANRLGRPALIPPRSIDMSQYQPDQTSYQTGAPADFPGKTLGIVGLVLAILIPLVGLIVSIIAQNQSKAAGYPNKPAKIGVIVAIILMVLGLLIGIGSAILGIGAANSGY